MTEKPDDTLKTLRGQMDDLRFHLRIFIGNDENRELLTRAIWRLGSIIVLHEAGTPPDCTAEVSNEVHELIVTMDCRIIQMTDSAWKAVKARMK